MPFSLLAQAPPLPATEQQAAELRALMNGAPKLPLELKPLAIQLPSSDWNTEYVSSVAVAPDGAIYALHRGLKHDPVLVLDREGRIVRSWGRGLYTIPHSVRVDPDGNVWTVDAGSSVILKFTPEGKQLLRIDVGELPERGSSFRGTADVTFARGRVYIADGYGNARVLVYDQSGRRLKQWGTPGTASGQFHLVHGITVDSAGVLYVADRENGRIQRFDLDGKPLGEWNHLGKTFALEIDREGALWIGTQPRNLPNGAEGWVAKVDRKTGKVQGVAPSPGFHSIAVNRVGEVLTGARSHRNAVVWFRRAPQGATR
jgi:DNA-binding beta-propeller fold protein YncE